MHSTHSPSSKKKHSSSQTKSSVAEQGAIRLSEVWFA